MTDTAYWYLLGGGSALLALILTIMMPVSPHRVNQTLVSVIIVALVLVAAFSIFDFPLALVAAAVGSAACLLYRDVLRRAKQFLWHNVFRYTHRYFWYNRVGRAILGARGARRQR